MDHENTFAECLRASERIDWRVEDLIGGENRLDFARPFLPEGLARVEELAFLSPRERLALSQIRGHEYLTMFGLVEEFILPFVLDHARKDLSSDDRRTRAFLSFAEEEAKHIQLFKAFRRAFRRGFPVECEVIGPPQAIADAVLAHPTLSVALLILHIEWMTQRHFQESVHGDTELDPCFESLLRHHWMEEAQHAKLDTCMVEELVRTMTPQEIREGLDGYAKIGAFLDEGMMQQVERNLQSLERWMGTPLGFDEQAEFREVQRDAIRWTYLESGATHPRFTETMTKLESMAAAPVAC
jgi:hypothetical protein